MSIRQHNMDILRLTNKWSIGGEYLCAQCECKSKQPKTVRSHKESRHRGVIILVTSVSIRQHDMDILRLTNKWSLGGKYFCAQCEYQSKQPRTLRSHKESTHKVVIQSCNQATQQENLRNQKDSIQRCITYSWHHCEYQTTRHGHLQTHKQVKHGG